MAKKTIQSVRSAGIKKQLKKAVKEAVKDIYAKILNVTIHFPSTTALKIRRCGFITLTVRRLESWATSRATAEASRYF